MIRLVLPDTEEMRAILRQLAAHAADDMVAHYEQEAEIHPEEAEKNLDLSCAATVFDVTVSRALGVA